MTLEHLTLWLDDEPRSGPSNMAVDEVLLLTSTTPMLRVYRWAGPWVSIGCFVPRAEAEAAFPNRPMVRRWTGGGIVDHADDWTYSLVVPHGQSLAALGTAESYRLIHQALALALTRCGLPAALADAPRPGRGGLCFERPVLADLLSGGSKIAGAAQRRTRHGLLHQGSVQGIAIPAALPTALAQALADGLGPTRAGPTPEHLARAEVISREKYAAASWLDRH